MSGQRVFVIAGLFAVSAVAVGVACGTASPVLYGVGDATPAVTGTGIVSTLIAAISGSSGLWMLLKLAFPKVAPIIDAASELIKDTKAVEGGADIVSSLLGGHLDPAEIGELTALLFVHLERAKSSDKEGADMAYALIQHIKEFDPPRGNNAKK